VFVLTEDGVVRVVDDAGARIIREFTFPGKVVRIALAARNQWVIAVQLADDTLLVCDSATGRVRSMPTGRRRSSRGLMFQS
jgi:hypothetical protein